VYREIQYGKRRLPIQDTPVPVSYSSREKFVIFKDAFEQWYQSQDFFITATVISMERLSPKRNFFKFKCGI